MAIVTTTYPYKPPPGKERLWGLDQVFLLAGRATTILEQCQLGFVSVVRFSAGPYAVISEADFETLEQELRATSLKRAR